MFYKSGNDIKNDCRPQTIFSDIQCVVRTFQDSGINRIFVCETIPRGNFKKVPGLTESRFNTIQTVINKRLRKDGDYGKYCVIMNDIKFPRHYDERGLCAHEQKGLRRYIFLVVKIIRALKF